MQIMHICIEIKMHLLHNCYMEDVHMSDLKTIRLEKGLTQKEAAERLGVSLRSYVTYENDESRSGTSKYRFFLHELAY